MSQIKKIEKRYSPSTTEQRIERARLVAVSDVASNVAGQIKYVITMDPTGTSEFSTYTSLYDEFRVVGVRLTLCSTQQYSVTISNSLVGIVYDNDDVAALTTIQQVAENPTVQWISAVFQHTATGMENKSICPQYSWARPTSGKNTSITWCDVAVPSQSLGSIKMYGEILTASASYYRVITEYFCEFRGRR